MIGFGGIGQALLPVIFEHLDVIPSQISIISKTDDGKDLARLWGVNFQVEMITTENIKSLLGPKLKPDDFVLNMSVSVSSLELIQLCQDKKALYLDLSTEPWDGIYTNSNLKPAERSNYALRESVLHLKGQKRSTAVITHGANPGLVSHFLKQALFNIAADNEIEISTPQTAREWAHLAHSLGIKVIHIAERDTQSTNLQKSPKEFINTWSIDGFIEELEQPAELGWGTHEKHWPKDGFNHKEGSKSGIYLERCGAATKIRSWTPSLGAYHGFLVTHAESISIADYLTVKDKEQIIYRPTVHYAYLPCPDAVLSINDLVGAEYSHPKINTLITDQILEGYDELGVLLMGNKKGAYWFGSHLSIHEARKLFSTCNATNLQVVAGAISGMLWAYDNRDKGLVEPEEMDFEYILDIAKPYLGEFGGHYTDWTPLINRNVLFNEELDWDDPWQFLNIRVS